MAPCTLGQPSLAVGAVGASGHCLAHHLIVVVMPMAAEETISEGRVHKAECVRFVAAVTVVEMTV